MSGGTTPRVSIVVCSIDAGKFARVTANYRRLYAGVPIEIIGIHDARSLAEAYSRGIARARAPTVILSHDDIAILTPDFAARVARHLATFDLIGVAGTTRVVGGRWAAAGDPHVFCLIASPLEGKFGVMLVGGGPLVVPDIQGIDGVLMAMRRGVAESTGFDAATFDGFHLYDLDFSFRAYRAGRRLAVCRDLALIHESTGHYDAIWAEYARRFVAKHREHLHPATAAVEGARATFVAASEAEVLRQCDPARLESIVGQITAANIAL